MIEPEQIEALLTQGDKARAVLDRLRINGATWQSLRGPTLNLPLSLGKGEQAIDLPPLFDDPATRAAAVEHLRKLIETDLAELAGIVWLPADG